jgi:hypothetical protein
MAGMAGCVAQRLMERCTGRFDGVDHRCAHRVTAPEWSPLQTIAEGRESASIMHQSTWGKR